MRSVHLRIGAIGVLALLAAGATGCATRGYVRDQVAGLRTSMVTADDSLGKELQAVQGVASGADSRATAAVRRVDSVQEMALGWVGYREVDRYRVYFPFNSADPEAESGAVLEQVAENLGRNPQMLVELYGFADPTGPAAYNLELGRRRAEAVLRLLADCVPGRLGRFQAVSFGERPPQREEANLGTGAARRLVEIVLVEKTAPDATNEAISTRLPRPERW